MEHQNQSNDNSMQYQPAWWQKPIFIVDAHKGTITVTNENDEKVVIDIEKLKNANQYAITQFPVNSQNFKSCLSNVLRAGSSKRAFDLIKTADTARVTLKSIKDIQDLLTDVQQIVREPSFDVDNTLKTFKYGIDLLRFLQTPKISDELKMRLESIQPGSNFKERLWGACEKILFFRTSCKELIHFLVDFELGSKTDSEKLVSCYIFNICYLLSSFYYKQSTTEDYKLCAVQEILETVWMEAYKLNDVSMNQMVKRYKKELKDLTGWESSSERSSLSSDKNSLEDLEEQGVEIMAKEVEIIAEAQIEESKQSQGSLPLQVAQMLVVSEEDQVSLTTSFLNLDDQLKEFHTFLEKNLFEQKYYNPIQKQLCLKSNFEQNERVTTYQKEMTSYLNSAVNYSRLIQRLNLFSEVKFGSCFEILQKFQRKEIQFQNTELLKGLEKGIEDNINSNVTQLLRISSLCRQVSHHMVEFDYNSINEADRKMSYFVFSFCHSFEDEENFILVPEQILLQKIWKHAYQLKKPTDAQATLQKFEQSFAAGQDELMEEDQIPQ